MENGVETVIGRGGNASVRAGELLIFSSDEVIFRAPCEKVLTADLLSGDGVVLKGPDTVSGLSERTVTVYFVDYRK